jgi:DNA polymerase-3 subunit epsilon/ATP-dependent DNA helicase DinG
VEQDPLQHRLTLQAAPLDIGRLMEKTLWYSKESVILTSATLTTHGEFDYLRRRLNAEDADELTVGSPFDYENSALVYLARDIPEPKEAHPFQKAAEETLVRLAKATGGRMLALFTSYAQLQRTSRAIEGPLAKADITVYEQGEGASASALLDVFKETPRAVLLGTRAFWEGVDVPGEALSVLVITKLPFDVPSDPIVEARSESFDDPFNEYMLPEAILRFRQGFGRLIRTQTDRGVVAILDKRILSKQYGRLFMESLPDCTVIEGSLANLPEKAASWLGS